ncbi:phenylalanine--tRNA ligase subunit beta [Candidatus Saccharibacteria bacterium oral taxon 488]|nr:phenylalanine--tRNA ligase subunit beta [Candidatus Saccharibacteria bacterium oral taxon 488]
MKVSLNLIKQLINFELPTVDELVARVNQQLGGVEAVIDLKAKYGGARIVRVVECVKHPDADRLSVTKIDDGGVVADVPRDDNGLVQVVCGAPNVHADMWAIWLPPKSTVPVSFDDDEPFVLDARPLRGVLSQGMLAAADELDIGTDHEGIIEIHEHDVPAGVELRAGASFAKMFGLDDYVLDIENKMFTHRPDCFGQLGVAREIAGIFHQQFTSPEWYNVIQEFAGGDGLELEIFNEATEVVPVFSAVAIKNVEVHPSPLWLQCQLVAMGGKPINNIVDATNYMMLLTAQPTHAYDYDKLRGRTLGARLARDGEKVSLLNGKDYELTNDDIVIADGEGVIGLAGIMGGADTEVSNGTKNIILECVNFDMYALRRTAMRHGIFTDALTRFNKGQSPAQTDPVLKQLMGMVGGVQASPVLFKNHQSLRSVLADGTHWCGGLLVPSGFVEERLGVNFADGEMNTLLGNVEFFVDEGREYGEDGMMVYSPFWRTDIELPEDIVEEVGRLYGFDKLPRQLPRRSIKPAPKNLRRELKNAVRHSLSRAGANEVLTYSFVHERILKNAEQDVAQAYKLSNALSPDLQYYRLTVLPSLLDKVHANIKAGHDEFALFEMGKGHVKMHGLGEDGLPEASQFTDIVYAAKKPGAGAPFYTIRRSVEQLARDLGAELVFKPIEQELTLPAAAPFDQSRSALVETTDGQFIGMVGELKQSVIKNFKLPAYVAAASLDTAGLEAVYAKRDSHYQPLSRYPSTTRDISLKVPSAVRYQQLLRTLDEVVQDVDMAVRLELLTIYQPEDDAAQKTITWRLAFTSHERTLVDKDITPVIQRIEQIAKDRWGAEIV